MATLQTIASTAYPAGATILPSYGVPPAAVLKITTSLIIDATDLADPTKTITIECDRLVGSTWTFDHGFTWVGNTISRVTGLPENPSITVGVGPLAGASVRIIITPNATITAAITVTTG